LTLQQYLSGKVTRIAVQTVIDHRGRLTPIHFNFAGFTPVRAFVVAAPDGAVRGGHAHAICRQVLMCVAGEVEVTVNDGKDCAQVLLTPTNGALLIEPMVWGQQVFRGVDASMVVFCDQPFDKDEYLYSMLELVPKT
jgi:hypothetical protein